MIINDYSRIINTIFKNNYPAGLNKVIM